MSTLVAFLRSTIGRKVVMALSGLALLGFVVSHFIGNLLAYKGPEALNAYAEGLRHYPQLLWGARLGLLAAVAAHIWASVSLTRSNLQARPQSYDERANLASTYASRTMVVSGPLLAIFIVYHLMHLTVGNAHGSFIPGDVYHNFVSGFRVPLVSAFYIVAMVALGLHMRHGIYSMLQTLGANHPSYNALRHAVAAGITAVVVLGNISFPIAVLTGVIR